VEKRNYSIVELTIIKVSVVVIVILVLIYFLIARIYWEKEVVKRECELLSVASSVEKMVQGHYKDILAYKEQNELSRGDKANGIRSLLLENYDNISNNNSGMEIGYYDLELDSMIPIVPNPSEHVLKKIYSQELFLSLKKSGAPQFITDSEVGDWDGQGVIAVAAPIYYQSQIMGYSWAAVQSSNIFYSSWQEYLKILIFSLVLWFFILVIIRNSVVKIELSLDSFSRMIVNNKTDNAKDLEQLPELKPVFERINAHLDNLRDLNTELESSNDKLLTIMGGIADGFFSLDRNWRVTFINEETKRVLTADRDLLGENIWEFFEGRIEPVTQDNLKHVMEENIQMHWETQSVNGDKYFQYHAYPFVQGLTVFVRDITNDKKNEQELQRLERLNLIGQMAAGISHEIRNPLTTVRGFLQMMEAKSDSPKNKEYMELMISEIDRANEIITDFLSLSKVNSEGLKIENLNEIINRIYPMLQADAFNSDKDITLDLKDIPDLGLNESEIRQLILNLVRNGLEETPRRGYVSIRTYCDENNVVLAIQDQGKGIPQEVQDKLGTPFLTTKESGTGLGLAISIGIAHRHNAKLEFETGDKGTTFFILFPIKKYLIKM